MTTLLGLNNPVPRDLQSESQKAARILRDFVKPGQAYGADQIIPPYVLQNARGLAVITVLKAGFLFSGRAGSGVIVTRLRDGSWSAPSAIAMGGAGAGGLIGFELTDFVFILNSQEAVDTFSEIGSVTFGGNISVAAGPVGRNTEADATASTGGIASVYTYSKSKGLFAGVSVEGSAIIERRDENKSAYGSHATAKRILSGEIEPLPCMDSLYAILETRCFTPPTNPNYAPYEDYGNRYYDDIPDSFSVYESSRRSNNGGYVPRSRARFDRNSGYQQASPQNQYDREYDNRQYDNRQYDNKQYDNRQYDNRQSDGRQYNDSRDMRPNSPPNNHPPPQRGEYEGHHQVHRVPPPLDQNHSPPPNSQQTPPMNPRPLPPRPGQAQIRARALFNFTGQEPGDLSFSKDDIIVVVKKSESTNDWWKGNLNGTEGIFPANYVELI
ncbi:LAS seventeen-binding protein 3 [Nakaseomyces bracarensis]|uniref:LAS seventeen-binding protein 3 n=1 Tax=Nakaseomyces bracarensis TaxID=273131 RepID=A0ABR4NQ09_9SACH